MAGVSSDKEMPDFMVGTCLSMCPSEEIRLRQREGLVHSLEMAIGANGEKLKYGNPRLMVKEFSRSAAGHEIKPSDIRPLPVLAKTVKFLLTSTCCRTDVPWVLIYQFVNDRLRAVRQDLCVQGVKNIECIKLHLSSVRFYVYAHYRTCEHGVADFDPYLNKKTLMETITLVLSLYQDLKEEASETYSVESLGEENWPEEGSEEDVSERKIQKDAQANEKNFSEEKATAESTFKKFDDLHLQEKQLEEGYASSNTDHPADGLFAQSESYGTGLESSENYKEIENYTIREEAEAFYILVHFGSEEALSHALGLPKYIRCSPLVSLVLEMNTAWLTHNYRRVLHLSSFLPPLCVCAFHPHIAIIERKALAILSRSHSCKGQLYDKRDLGKTLFFSDTKSMAEACAHYGIALTEAGISFNRESFKADVPMRKITRLHWIEEKLDKMQLSKLLFPQDCQEDLCSESGETEVFDGSFSRDEVAVPPTPETAQLSEPNIESGTLVVNIPGMDNNSRNDSPKFLSQVMFKECADDANPLSQHIGKREIVTDEVGKALLLQPLEVEYKEEAVVQLATPKPCQGDSTVHPLLEVDTGKTVTTHTCMKKADSSSSGITIQSYHPEQVWKEATVQQSAFEIDMSCNSQIISMTSENNIEVVAKLQARVSESEDAGLSLCSQQLNEEEQLYPSGETIFSSKGSGLPHLSEKLSISCKIQSEILPSDPTNNKDSLSVAQKHSEDVNECYSQPAKDAKSCQDTVRQPIHVEQEDSSGFETWQPASCMLETYRGRSSVQAGSSDAIITQTLPVYPGNDSLNEAYQSSTPEASSVCLSQELVAQADSGKKSAKSSKMDLRQRKRLVEKEAMAKKVKKMVERQRANENWLEKKNLVYKPIAICAAFVLLGVGSGILLYQYLYV